MQIEQLYQLYLKHPHIQTDTRKLKSGELFFALKGETFNGNLFAQQALEKGAAVVVVDEETGVDSPLIFRVQDVLDTLQQLAKYHRLQLKIPVLAITGSNGKTTTKELIHAVLSSQFKTSTTEGNLNNHIGIPLTLLKIPMDAEIAVVEMGANHQQEIAGYCTYTLPTHGLINNVGKAHLEGFGGIEGVKKGKGELYDFIRESNGTIFMNTDFEYLHEMSKGIKHVFTYGSSNAAITGKIAENTPFLTVELTGFDSPALIHTRLVGDYNLPNVLAAVAVGTYFKVPFERIQKAIEAYIPSNSRSQMIQKDGHHIILDAYNANPSSMKAAIENFSKLESTSKILMLGAMAELGAESMHEHQEVINLIKKYNWKDVILVGGDFLKLNPPFIVFEHAGQARDWFQTNVPPGSHILIKGSRSMKMERILED